MFSSLGGNNEEDIYIPSNKRPIEKWKKTREEERVRFKYQFRNRLRISHQKPNDKSHFYSEVNCMFFKGEKKLLYWMKKNPVIRIYNFDRSLECEFFHNQYDEEGKKGKEMEILSLTFYNDLLVVGDRIGMITFYEISNSFKMIKQIKIGKNTNKYHHQLLMFDKDTIISASTNIESKDGGAVYKIYWNGLSENRTEENELIKNNELGYDYCTLFNQENIWNKIIRMKIESNCILISGSYNPQITKIDVLSGNVITSFPTTNDPRRYVRALGSFLSSKEVEILISSDELGIHIWKNNGENIKYIDRELFKFEPIHSFLQISKNKFIMGSSQGTLFTVDSEKEEVWDEFQNSRSRVCSLNWCSKNEEKIIFCYSFSFSIFGVCEIRCSFKDLGIDEFESIGDKDIPCFGKKMK